MNNLAVKICGITNYEDAMMAVDLGATALGFIFAASPRQITPPKVRDIIHAIPPFVKTVGVFVNEGPAEIKEMVHYCGLDLVQLHGDESPDLCHELMPSAIKALRIKDASNIQSSLSYQGKVRALLLDTYAKDKAGGTGSTFDWRLAIKIKELGIPIILAGGLDPSNIDSAIRTVKPYAVDVNSGVEECPGKKSPTLMKDLMKKVRRMNL
ncbi:MAG: phosphoribosylanthranilate isomerase [Desulfobacteraceae bacterium]|jgi:phosphoribosylanthranilate isomerase|nr:phosphoribosylanthranilate isomerase [Desulfobacteraceae bacterium]